MATKPKPGGAPAGEEEGAEAKEAAPPKKSLVGSILGMLNPLAILKLPMLQKLIVLGGLLVVLGGGAAAYIFLGGAPAGEHGEAAAADHGGGHGGAASLCGSPRMVQARRAGPAATMAA